MKYRIFFEPIDMEGDTPEEAKWIVQMEMDAKQHVISKVLPIDEDGFIIEQPKTHAPL